MRQSSYNSSVKSLDKTHKSFLYTDENLISRFQSGDENAYIELVNRYKDRLKNFAFYFLKDDEQAEDIVQDTFIKLYQKKHYYRPIGKFSTWIYTITRNLANTELRKRKRQKTVYLSQFRKDKGNYEIPADVESAAQALENEFILKKIHEAIDKLPDNYRSVIILRDIQGLSYDEISDIVEVPLGTVKSRINRSRLQLQLELKDLKEE